MGMFSPDIIHLRQDESMNVIVDVWNLIEI
jgi:hypothetical protein